MHLSKSDCPILRTIADTIADEEIPLLLETAKNMISLMNEQKGIGLAAPQIGISKRLFVIKMIDNDKPWYFFNPEIIQFDTQTQELPEGCLSLPGIFSPVKRPKKIIVKYQDETAKIRKCTFEGMMSRCFQHEIDHLNGILFIDRIDSAAFEKKIEQLDKLLAEKFNVSRRPCS